MNDGVMMSEDGFGVTEAVEGPPMNPVHMRAMTAPPTGRPKKLSPAIVQSIREEFRQLIDGDLDDNLTQIEHLAARARDLFMTLKGGEAHIRQRTGVVGLQPNIGTYSSSWGGIVANGGVEQFGAISIRQLVEHLPEVITKVAEALANSPARQIEAIAAARKGGLDDVAEKLEQRLLHRPTPVTTDVSPAPAAPANGHNHALTAATTDHDTGHTNGAATPAA